MRLVIAGSIALALVGMSPRADAQGVPPGSYQGTCTNIRMDGNKLKALCTNRAGGHVVTELRDPERCGGDIANINGILQCQPARGYGQAPPPGYAPPPERGPVGPPGYGERREGGEEHCDRLRHRARELRERLRYDLPPDERRETEHRLWEIREEFRNSRCGDWHD